MATVLIVDDAVFMRRMLREILEEAGLQIVGEAASGDEAVRAYRELRPDVVTMDVVMPLKTGVESLREILAFDPQARVVIVSAVNQEPMIVEAMQLGARDYVLKPFRRFDVATAVARALGDTAPP